MTREQRHEGRLAQAHALAVKRARRGIPYDSSDVDDTEIHSDDLIIAERAAAARPGI